jgi:uncharacterized protein (DUF433 family)
LHLPTVAHGFPSASLFIGGSDFYPTPLHFCHREHPKYMMIDYIPVAWAIRPVTRSRQELGTKAIGLTGRDSRKWATLQKKGVKEMAGSIIVSNPAILSGEPVFRGTRVPFKSLTDYLEHERSLSEFLEDFPSVSRADAIAALEEARISLTAILK